MSRNVAACVAVLLALFEIGACTRCYQCNSQSEAACGDPFQPDKLPAGRLVDCKTDAPISYNQNYLYNILPSEAFGGTPGAPKHCHKIIMATGTVIRTCLDVNPNNVEKTCQDIEKNSKTSILAKQIKSCSVCDKDSCNGASSLAFSLPLALLPVLAAYLMKQ